MKFWLFQMVISLLVGISLQLFLTQTELTLITLKTQSWLILLKMQQNHTKLFNHGATKLMFMHLHTMNQLRLLLDISITHLKHLQLTEVHHFLITLLVHIKNMQIQSQLKLHIMTLLLTITTLSQPKMVKMLLLSLWEEQDFLVGTWETLFIQTIEKCLQQVISIDILKMMKKMVITKTSELKFLQKH